MRKNQQLKDNEILIFTDFNETIVPFAGEYNSCSCMYTENKMNEVPAIKARVTRALKDFERETGLTPVICVVTNASLATIDANDAPGIHQDMRMTFFDHSNDSPERAKMVYENTCEKYFRYLVYKENDYYFEINPLGNSLSDVFVPQAFSEEQRAIRMASSHKKLESVERIASMMCPDRSKIKHCIFAGDSIKDDYPMKLIKTPEGTCKIFIRPGKVQKMKPSIMQEFCGAMGVEFSQVKTSKGKPVRVFDNDNIKYLPENERVMLENYHGGDHVLLTNPNTRGFVEGLYQAIDIIKAHQKENPNQMDR